MNRWRDAFVVLASIAVVCGGIALFTTYDSITVGDTFCGSPSEPEAATVPACVEKVGHARATRTAALAWGMASLVGAWACDVRRRRALGGSSPGLGTSTGRPLPQGPVASTRSERRRRRRDSR